MSKNQWGRPIWHKLHTLAIHYSDAPTMNDMVQMHRTIYDIVETLPCPTCVQHASQYLARNSMALHNSKKLQAWVHKFHNYVNAMTGKVIVTEKEYDRIYASELALAGRQGLSVPGVAAAGRPWPWPHQGGAPRRWPARA